MTDLSNKEIMLSFNVVNDMRKRFDSFKKKEKREPKTIFINDSKKDFVSLSRFKDMIKRTLDFKTVNKRYPDNIWIVKPKTNENVLKPSANINATYPKLNINGKQVQPKTITEFYNLMGGFGYSGYYNDIYSLNEEISRISQGKALNCSDFSQLLTYVASQFIKDGKKVYSTKYVHLRCKSGTGHIAVDVKGGEFGNTYKRIDLAAKADKESRVYPIGDYWCKDGKVESYDDSWLKTDDGKT